MNFKKIIAKHQKNGCLALLTFWAVPSITLGANYNVAPGFDSDCSDGYCNLQSALNAAAMNSGSNITINLSQGVYLGNFTYFPASNNIGNIEISGGWDSAFSSRTVDAINTVLDGNNTGTVLNLKLQDWNHPVVISGNIKVDGLTIKNGSSYIGGGLIAYTAYPGNIDITNCIIENNHADDAGGGCAVGVYDFVTNAGGNVYLYGNTIRNNNLITTNLQLLFRGIGRYLSQALWDTSPKAHLKGESHGQKQSPIPARFEFDTISLPIRH